MREDSPEPSRSPWSTPTESEIYEAHRRASFVKEKDAAFKELGLKVKTPSPNKKPVKKQPNMADAKLSPKKKAAKKGKAKQKEAEGDNNETKVNEESGNDNQITDITIPDVIPPPPDAEEGNVETNADDVAGAEEIAESAMEKLDIGDDKTPEPGSSPRGSRAGLQGDSESSPTKRGGKNIKASDKKGPAKKKNASKNETKKSRSNSPEKAVNKGKNRKESLGVEQNSTVSQDRTGSSNSKGSGDSLKLGADYTTINGELNTESGSSAGANNLENGDENISDGKTMTERPTNSPKKRKGKLNSSLRRESAATRSTSSSPKKTPTGKGKRTSITPAVIADDPNQWSSEKKAMEKWKTLATSNGEVDPEKLAEFIQGDSGVNVKDGDVGNKKAQKRRESKAQPTSPSKAPASPQKSPSKSPPKSPTKSPRKKLKDVLQLPPPYDDITSGKLRHWETAASRGEKIDDEKYPEYEHVR